MSESDQEPQSHYRNVSVPDEDLPDDLRTGEDNPLADATGEDAERQDLGDPQMPGLERDDDDNLSLPQDADADASDHAHHGAPDSDD
jgi:hypothetical protein